MLAGEGLRASSLGKRVHFSGTKRTVTDGPFAETKELIAGYWIWKVKSMDEAVEWVKRCPNPHKRRQRHRNPPVLRDGGLRPGVHTRGARTARSGCASRSTNEDSVAQRDARGGYCVSRPARGPWLSRTGA